MHKKTLHDKQRIDDHSNDDASNNVAIVTIISEDKNHAINENTNVGNDIFNFVIYL